MATSSQEVRYLNPPAVDTTKKKYCRFKKNGIKYIDYKESYNHPGQPAKTRGKIRENHQNEINFFVTVSSPVWQGRRYRRPCPSC